MMNRDWKATLRVTQHEMKLLVTRPEGDLLKARLGIPPSHPRALLTLLEGVSLWRGQPLCVALRVDERCPSWPCSRLFGDELWPGESQLVRFEAAPRGHRPVPLAGLGNFRALRSWAP
jgi:hypothetical protein